MSELPHDAAPEAPRGASSLRLEALHLLVTYRCTYACDHCFVWGSPEQESTMTLAQLRAVIEQAAAAGCAMVYFEGGEPMLAYPVVLAATRHAREAGLEVGIVTNCFWAESFDDALAWLAPLAKLGVADLALSSYAYFTESLDDEAHLRNAVGAAQWLGLPTAVLEVGAPAALADLGVPCGTPGEIMFKGRASEALACGERLTRSPDTLTSCPYEDFTDPGRCHVGCDGNLMPCQGISIGNLWQRPLADILATHDPASLPVVREIAAGGPWALAQATGLAPARPLYADECHLCYELRSRLRTAGRYLEVLAPDQCYGVNQPPGAAGPAQRARHERRSTVTPPGSPAANAGAAGRDHAPDGGDAVLRDWTPDEGETAGRRAVVASVALEPFGPADYARLVTWIADEEQLLQWAGPIFQWPLDEGQLDAYLAPAREPDATRLVWRAVATPGGAVVGHVELNDIDRRQRAATLSRVLVCPDHRGRGVAQAMIAAALEVAFGALGLHRVEARVFDFNEPAIRCYEGLGFRREGLLRDRCRSGHEYWSTLVMALLDHEWRARRKES